MKPPLHQSKKNCMMLSQIEGRHIGLPLRKSSYFFDLITPFSLKGVSEGDNFIIQHSHINAHYFKRIVGHADLLNQVKMKTKIRHAMAVATLYEDRAQFIALTLYSLVGA